MGMVEDEKDSKKKQGIPAKILKLFLILAFFPIYATFKLLHPLERIAKLKAFGLAHTLTELKKRLVFNIISFFANVVIVLILTAIWTFGYFLLWLTAFEMLGFNPQSVPISGTGSMYPTFPKSYEKDIKKQSKDIIGNYDFMPYPNGLVLFGKRFFGYTLGRGDIVTAYNKVIGEYSKKLYGVESGIVKRIVGMPGDTLEIRGGLLYIDGKPYLEPYTAKPHSTFGEAFLGECKKITIPQNKYFLVGDNRKGSGDSREFGWVDEKDINRVIYWNNQIGKLDKNFRDTSADLDDSTKIKLNTRKYLELLNEKRKEKGVQLIKYQPLLEKSAYKRGEVIIKNNDFSFEATVSGYTVLSAMNDVGYWNPYYGEAPSQGYFEADELIENQFQDTGAKKFLLDNTYQELGIAEVEGEINGCPTQVVVLHFAGYVPPNYKKDVIESWRTALNQLKSIQSSWAELKYKPGFYDGNKADVDRINEIITTRITNLGSVVSKMDANQWLNDQQNNYLNNFDRNLYNEQENIAKKLNAR